MSKRLGKGLEALIPSLEIDEEDQVTHIPLDELRPNPYQPRKQFSATSIEELRHSIETHGVIQPIIVRKSIKGFEIIAGERRYRASKAAQRETIPAVVKQLSESEVMEIALIENTQREDLNAIEVAKAYQKLMQKFQLTQEELAKKVGKSRPHVTNFIRLLQLPENVQEYVSRGTLSMGHARTLSGLQDRKLIKQLVQKCFDEHLSVRQLEQLVQKIENHVPRGTKKRKKKKEDVFLHQYEEQLRSTLGTSVKISKGEKKGKIEIEFFSEKDLQRIIELLQDEA